MSSLRRLRASRANGARSRGPKSPEGKERVRYNALQHGYLSQIVVLPNESRENFDELLQQHVHRFVPLDAVESSMVEEMTNAYWRQRRLWCVETKMYEVALAQQPENPDEAYRLLGAFRHLAARPEFELLHRYEARLHNQHRRALHSLLVLQDRKNPIQDDSCVALSEPEPLPQSATETSVPPLACDETPVPSAHAETSQEHGVPNEPSPICGQHPMSVSDCLPVAREHAPDTHRTRP